MTNQCARTDRTTAASGVPERLRQHRLARRRAPHRGRWLAVPGGSHAPCAQPSVSPALHRRRLRLAIQRSPRSEWPASARCHPFCSYAACSMPTTSSSTSFGDVSAIRCVDCPAHHRQPAVRSSGRPRIEARGPPGTGGSGDRRELAPAYEGDVGRATLRADVVAHPQGGGGDGIEDGPQRGLRAGVLPIDVLLQRRVLMACCLGGRIGDRPLRVLLHAMLGAKPGTNGLLVEGIRAECLGRGRPTRRGRDRCGPPWTP